MKPLRLPARLRMPDVGDGRRASYLERLVDLVSVVAFKLRSAQRALPAAA